MSWLDSCRRVKEKPHIGYGKMPKPKTKEKNNKLVFLFVGKKWATTRKIRNRMSERIRLGQQTIKHHLDLLFYKGKIEKEIEGGVNVWRRKV